jgi:hypothetical protein
MTSADLWHIARRIHTLNHRVRLEADSKPRGSEYRRGAADLIRQRRAMYRACVAARARARRACGALSAFTDNNESIDHLAGR